MRYDAVEVGDVDEFGSYEMTEAEMIDFAEQYDPQPFHVDPEAAAEYPYGGLIASGWHTCAATMRMLVENQFRDGDNLGSPGLDELRWHEPVRPGDVLSVRVEVIGKRPLESDPERGLVTSEVETRTADGTLVLSWTSNVFVRRFPAE
ncbi:MaoC family dehydratase [Salinarchaeum chitinilyticum]